MVEKDANNAIESSQRPMCRSMQLHYILKHRFNFRSNFSRMRLSWESHNKSQETNRRHCVTGPQLPFFHKDYVC